MQAIFKAFFEFVTILLQFCVLVFGLEACGILAPRPGIKHSPSALEGGVLTTGTPLKSPKSLVLNLHSHTSRPWAGFSAGLFGRPSRRERKGEKARISQASWAVSFQAHWWPLDGTSSLKAIPSWMSSIDDKEAAHRASSPGSLQSVLHGLNMFWCLKIALSQSDCK